MFPALRGLAFVDGGNIIGRISQLLKLIAAVKPVFKLDDNLGPKLSGHCTGFYFQYVLRRGHRNTGDSLGHRHLH